GADDLVDGVSGTGRRRAARLVPGAGRGRPVHRKASSVSEQGMSTSDQNGHGQLTRKQLREIRLTGSTPVITGEEPAAAAQPSTVLPRAAEPVEIAPVPDVEVTESDAPLTRRQMRALEHLRAAGEEQAGDSAAEPQAV